MCLKLSSVAKSAAQAYRLSCEGGNVSLELEDVGQVRVGAPVERR